jgi:hypothetical protein
VINDHEPMIPTGDGQIAETRKGQTAGAFTDVSQSSRSPNLVANGGGSFLSGLVDWRHGSVAVLLPCGCHDLWLNVLYGALLAYPRGVCSGAWSKVAGTWETRHERR